MRGSMAGILYASGLSLSRCGHQQALAAVGAAIVCLVEAGVNGAPLGLGYRPQSKHSRSPSRAMIQHRYLS